MMINFKRSIVSLFAIVCMISNSLQAQDTSPATVDSTFEQYMSGAWNKIQESKMDDSLQQHYSKEFYSYYREHRQTKTGKQALTGAFMMWGNTGDARYLNEALQTIDYDSDLWARILTGVGNLYFRNDSLENDQYFVLLRDLKEKLTHPESKSKVLLSLLRLQKGEVKKSEAKRLAQDLVEINANEFYVEQGKGYIYELENLNIGQQAPAFKTKSVSGENIALSNYRGTYVLLDFWATWCGPCLPEIQHLKALKETYDDDRFRIIGISLDRKKEELTTFMENENINWPQVLQQKEWEGEISQLYNISGIPQTYFIGPEGKILAKDLRGESMPEEIAKLMEQ